MFVHKYNDTFFLLALLSRNNFVWTGYLSGCPYLSTEQSELFQDTLSVHKDVIQ